MEEIVPSTFAATSSSDIKFEMILKAMEKITDKLIVDSRPWNREQSLKSGIQISEDPILLNPHKSDRGI